MKALECAQYFSHYKSMGIFPDAQGQLNSQSLVRSGRISNSSEMLLMSLLPASMKKIRSKMKALEWTQHYTAIFQTRKGRLHWFVSVSGRNLNSSKPLCTSSLPAKMRMIDSKMKELECSQDFSHYKSMGIFPDAQAANSAVLSPIWPNFEFVRDVMHVLITCKYEEVPIKNEGARVDTTLYSNFSDAQGQINLVLVSVSGRNLYASKLICMSSLPARMRMIDSKIKQLECSQDFSHYKSMGIFSDAQGQLPPQSLIRSSRISNSSEML